MMNRSISSPDAVSRILAGYRPAPGCHDELVTPDGALRSHWVELVRALDQLGLDELRTRREGTRRILHEHGTTHDLHGDWEGVDRPWELDLLPMILAPQEWRAVEAGLIQRTRLLRHILADLYGPQRLLHERRLPAALVQANPAFLRPCLGAVDARTDSLFLHAVDLARSPDGRWWVVADHTGVMAGAGYALENRVVVSRLLPEVFHQCQVLPLTTFFDGLRDSLQRRASQTGDAANVVLLTAGHGNEDYFEQVYLARHLGLPLVEGEDLTVRREGLFLKTLEGLRPVDVVLRHLEDHRIDPLELDPSSRVGVPGLVEAVRARQVTLANPIGSALVETPALAAFLPALCRHLMGEDLRLPSVATWWCGQEREQRYVLEHLDRLQVRSAYPILSGMPDASLGTEPRDLERVAAEVRRSPHAYIGQERVTSSQVPLWSSPGFNPGPMILRAYIHADGDSIAVMPGGLVRVGQREDARALSRRSGEACKDLWIPSDTVVAPATHYPARVVAQRLERVTGDLPSRVADNLFWLGRYLERLEDTVRLLRSLLSRLAGESRYEPTPEVVGLVRLLVRLDLLPAGLRDAFTVPQLEREVFTVIFQANRLGAIRELIDRLRRMAFVVRDRFSTDTWRVLNKLQADVRLQPRRTPWTEALPLLNTLIFDLAALSGLESENMTRGHAWLFLELGRRLERAVNMLTLTQAALNVESSGHSVLEPMLEIADSVMTYRRRYFAPPQPAPVLHLVLLDDSNPRSLLFQCDTLARHLGQLPRELHQSARQLAASRESLRHQDVEALAAVGLFALPGAMSGLLQQTMMSLRGLSDAITHEYFSHARARCAT
jgi:uncharacterized circularly permuted ATP-grasp superfamily protein/uncharacterized alpha-E superfamily protein